MTAKTPDGKVIKRYSKFFMGVPAKFGRGTAMGRGPYEKSGLIRNFALLPYHPLKEAFEFVFPHKVVKQGKRKVEEVLSKEINIDVEVWYYPYGPEEKFKRFRRLWKKVTKTVTLEE